MYWQVGHKSSKGQMVMKVRRQEPVVLHRKACEMPLVPDWMEKRNFDKEYMLSSSNIWAEG